MYFTTICHSFNTSQFCVQTETLSLDLILWDCSLRAAILKMPVFWDVMSHWMVISYQTAWHHIHNNSNLQS